MKKGLLTTALIVSALSVSNAAFSQETNIASVIDQTITGQSFAGNGGAILYNAGTSTIKGSTFTENKSTGENFGGAIHVTKATLNISDSTFTGNSAYAGGAVTSGTTNSNLIIENSTFTENFAEAYGAVGIFKDATIKNTTFKGNYTTNAEEDGGGAAYFGAKAAVMTLDNTTFENNTSASAGGAIGTRYATKNNLSAAILNITNSTFKNNTAATVGGAFDNYFYNNTSVTNSTFTGNKAADGGAIYNHGETDITGNSANLKISDSVFSGNSATNKYGGAIYTESDLTIDNTKFDGNEIHSATAYSGGAIFVDAIDKTVNITNSTFTNNKAINTVSFADGAAISVKNGTVNISNSTFENNKADWGTVYQYASGESTINIDNSTFKNNEARGVGGVGIFDIGKITNTKFEGNKATDVNDDGAGALYVGAEGSVAVLDKTEFIGNTSVISGGAIGTRYASSGTNLSAAILNITNSTFTNNTAGTTGGAIDYYLYNSANGISNSTFTGNKAANGGAIYNHGEIDSTGNSANLKISDSVFSGNSATSKGGAIYTESDLTIDNTKFDGNEINSNSAVSGGAIFVNAIDKTVNITNSTFTNNTAINTDSFDADGAAISVKNGTVNISNSTFENNKADWGTVYQYTSGNSTINISNSTFKNNITRSVGGVGIFNTGNITNTIFEGNKATDVNDDGAGALFVGSVSGTKLENVTFTDNYSAAVGGAIATRGITKGDNSAAKLDIINATFTNNSADKDGGAIYNAFYHSVNSTDNVYVKNSTFEGNKSAKNGGAIYNAAADLAGNTSSIYIEDTSFSNNSASENGGAIYSHGDITLVANQKDITFSGNSAKEGGDIYMAAADKSINMSIADGRTIAINSGISGVADGYNINITGAGSFDVKSSIDNALMTIENATLILGAGSDVNGRNNSIILNNAHINSIDNQINNFEDGLFTFQGDNKISADIHIGTGKGDNYGGSIITETPSTLSLRAATTAASSSDITIEKINFIGETTDNNITIDVREALGLDQTDANVVIDSNVAISDVLSPIRYLKGAIDEQGRVSFAPRGNGWRDYNSAILAAPVAAQVGGYLNQLNSYEQAFMNLDMKMLMTKKQREAIKLRNRYAIAEAKAPMVFSPTNLPEKKDAGWVRPYANFEKVKLDGGPNVSNVMYGTFFGADSDMYEFENGAEAQFSVYAGYNGAHQSFHGNSMWQNGGTLGMTGILYKGNAFTAITANVGASSVEASTKYGSDDFNMLTSGIASKTGYNIELADSKFIIQPNYLMSYSFVNTFDYTNAAGVRVESDPLHAIQIAPGVKFIGNLENGWQPYANVRMVWNIMDNTDFKAANTALPELSMKPYVEYGVGLQKRWGDRFTGFGQAMLRSGGRNGVGFSFGFRWTFGKAPATVESATPKKAIKKTKTTKVSSL